MFLTCNKGSFNVFNVFLISFCFYNLILIISVSTKYLLLQMKGMMEMWGIKVGMREMRGIRVEMRGIGVGMREIRLGMMGIRVGMRGLRVGMMGIRERMRRTGGENARNKGENLCIRVELRYYNCGEGQETRNCGFLLYCTCLEAALYRCSSVKVFCRI